MTFSGIARWFAVLSILAGLTGTAVGLWIDADPAGALRDIGRPVVGGKLMEQGYLLVSIGLALGMLSEIRFALRRSSRIEEEE